MRDVLDTLTRWWEVGRPVAMATVVATRRSAPKPPGATMLVGPDGAVTGGVSGGCVEASVYELASEVLAGSPPVLRRYGVSDDDAFAVGLTCGGSIDVFVERVDQETYPQLGDVARDIRGSVPVAALTSVANSHSDPLIRLGRRLVVWNDRISGSLGADCVDHTAATAARRMLTAGDTGTLRHRYERGQHAEELTLLVSAFAPAPRMLVFGATDFAAAVASIGTFLGYRVTVCDARPAFATPERFPDVHQVVADWPHRYLRAQADGGLIDQRTVACVLTHDPKFDEPLLEIALRLPLAYVGALGSRRTHRKRLSRLREAGLTDLELSRLASPTGLDLGGRTPQETAVSIAAEIIATRAGGSGQPLTRLTTRLHPN